MEWLLWNGMATLAVLAVVVLGCVCIVQLAQYRTRLSPTDTLHRFLRGDGAGPWGEVWITDLLEWNTKRLVAQEYEEYEGWMLPTHTPQICSTAPPLTDELLWQILEDRDERALTNVRTFFSQGLLPSLGLKEGKKNRVRGPYPCQPRMVSVYCCCDRAHGIVCARGGGAGACYSTHPLPFAGQTCAEHCISISN